MSISHQVLGDPGKDNALLVRIDSGQEVTTLLFDCGDCLQCLALREIQSIDHLFFSHFHMDHVAGFDQFFRCNYGRESENHIWGPVQTIQIMHHRFRGYTWNLTAGSSAVWHVHEFDGTQLATSRFSPADGFQARQNDGAVSTTSLLLETKTFTVFAWLMQHHGPCLAFTVFEKQRENFNTERMHELGLRPGNWLGQLRAGTLEPFEHQGQVYTVDKLKAELVDVHPGESLAYLTDFLLDDESATFLAGNLANVTTLVCEAQYREADNELATKNHHMTTNAVGRLAARIKPHRLVLQHLSERYGREQWLDMLDEVRLHFPGAAFAPNWNIS